MYKLVTCDMDETLLSDDRIITPKTVAAIKAASAQGVYFVPNTGRNFLTIQDLSNKKANTLFPLMEGQLLKMRALKF